MLPLELVREQRLLVIITLIPVFVIWIFIISKRRSFWNKPIIDYLKNEVNPDRYMIAALNIGTAFIIVIPLVLNGFVAMTLAIFLNPDYLIDIMSWYFVEFRVFTIFAAFLTIYHAITRLWIQNKYHKNDAEKIGGV